MVSETERIKQLLTIIHNENIKLLSAALHPVFGGEIAKGYDEQFNRVLNAKIEEEKQDMER